ncbi:Hsp70 family protein [Actinoplanes solisilvae]|uniref:Hsp70 family protein n=1 Tax=Actinoplanes solisilvae TaxID=2486853 RepID=UPI000FD75072|nr:Hsp70 family protein [Actinoplanes solisilvae]
MKRTYGLGIDLGTTQTAAAVRDDDGRVDVVRLGGRRAEIPSLVFVKDDGELLIGEAAERRGPGEPSRLAREFKRRIGDPVPILVGGAPFSAHALTARLLRHVLDEVTRLRDAPPSAITLTQPANWGPYKREQFAQAVRLADAGDVRVITEPEAAALQHATARRIAPGETVMVYDLGGGTFDVALLRRDGDGFTLLGEPEGVEQLGGADFDEAVFAHVVAALDASFDPDDDEVVSALSRLRRDCVEAKEALSFDTETEIPVALPGVHTRVRLNRSELESMIAPSLEDTVAAVRRALRGAGVPAADVSAILLAGGSSRIPLVGQMLSEEFGRPVVADPHPEHSIAMGAAIATAPVQAPASSLPAPAPAARVQAAVPAPALAPVVAPRSPAQPTPTQVMPTPMPAPVPSPVAFARGAATVPSPASPPSTTEELTPIAVDVPLPYQIESPRRTRRLAMSGAALAVLLAVAAGTYLVLDRDKNRGNAQTPGPASSSTAPGIPTDAAILVRVDTGPGGITERLSKVASFKPALGTPRTQLKGTQTGDWLPRWSHDREQIALTHFNPGSTSDIVVMNRDGGERRVLLRGVTSGRVTWSPDDTQLAFVKKVRDINQIFTIPVAGGTPTQLTFSGATKDDPVWSTKGNKIIYWAERNGVKQIFELSADAPQEPGRAVTTPAQGNAVDPALSPDDSKILYTRQVNDDDSDIWIINTNGSNPVRLTDDPAREMDPSWSPDGSWYAFVRGPYEAPTVVAQRPDGTGETLLTAKGAREGHPCWF